MRKIFFLLLLYIPIFSIAQQNADTSLPGKSNPSAIEIQKAHQKAYPYIASAAAVTYGFLSLGNNSVRKLDVSTKTELQEDHSGFHTKLDNYLQYSPAVAVYAINALGIKGENNFRDRTFIYAMTTIISSAVVISLKSITKEERPDGSANNSFPSGHTTTAFAAAAFLAHEYRNVSPWYGIAGYAVATTTGVLRLYNNKHWIGDVVAGAGFGYLSTQLAYKLYPVIKRKLFKTKVAAQPSF